MAMNSPMYLIQREVNKEFESFKSQILLLHLFYRNVSSFLLVLT